MPAVVERHGLKLNKLVLRQQDFEERGKRARDRNGAVAGGERPEQPMAAKSAPKQEDRPATPPPATGGNPYRPASNYGVLFALGSQKSWERQGLLEAGAKATGKDAKLVANDLAVLTNPAHASNKNRSRGEKDASGNVRLVKVQ